MVFFSQNPRGSGGFLPRPRPRYRNNNPYSRQEHNFLSQVQPRRGNYPYYPPNQFRRQESPFFIPNQYRQQPEEPYYDPYFQQQYSPQGLFGHSNRLNNLMGHVGTLSNGMNMLNQIGTMVGMFRGF